MTTPWNPRDYGPVVATLLVERRLCELGPGTPLRAVQPLLGQLTPENLVAPQPVRDRAMAACCLAGLWLHFDFLEESHALSQSLATVEGSYWHGLLHRREPDYENAKYWFARVGAHAIHAPLATAAATLAAGAADGPAAEVLSRQTPWDAARFVELCRRAAHRDTHSEALCREIQQCEWRLLFDYCYRRAIAPSQGK